MMRNAREYAEQITFEPIFAHGNQVKFHSNAPEIIYQAQTEAYEAGQRDMKFRVLKVSQGLVDPDSSIAKIGINAKLPDGKWMYQNEKLKRFHKDVMA